MNWWKVPVIAMQALSVLMTIALIGKPRKPLTPGVAVATLITAAALAFCVVMA